MPRRRPDSSSRGPPQPKQSVAFSSTAVMTPKTVTQHSRRGPPTALCVVACTRDADSPAVPASAPRRKLSCAAAESISSSVCGRHSKPGPCVPHPRSTLKISGLGAAASGIARACRWARTNWSPELSARLRGSVANRQARSCRASRSAERYAARSGAARTSLIARIPLAAERALRCRWPATRSRGSRWRSSGSDEPRRTAGPPPSSARSPCRTWRRSPVAEGARSAASLRRGAANG